MYIGGSGKVNLIVSLLHKCNSEFAIVEVCNDGVGINNTQTNSPFMYICFIQSNVWLCCSINVIVILVHAIHDTAKQYIM